MKVLHPCPRLIEDIDQSLYPRQTLGMHFAHVMPTQVSHPEYLCWSEDLAQKMGIKNKEAWLQTLAGNEVKEGMYPIATRYGGHQFGHWAGQLGDGRAIILAKIENNNDRFELQLKGAGLTPYSRHADGRAVLRSSLREFICSEAMHYLGVPTTRALSLVTTGEKVLRDMFYDGHPEYEAGAICSRVAPSFLRFGHFQIHTATGEQDQLQQLVDFTLENYFPGKSVEEFFESVMDSTAKLMSEWMRVGFVHGVMNTDNMSILGLTIDYGPYGWLDEFDLDWTPNTTDFSQRRYSFGNQPGIAYWNLGKLAEALSPMNVELGNILEEFPKRFHTYFQKMMASKLGLHYYNETLVLLVDDILIHYHGDMTIFYRFLMSTLEDKEINWQEAFYRPLDQIIQKQIDTFLDLWKEELHKQHGNKTKALEIMKNSNPVFIPRNYITQLALDGLARNDDSMLRKIERAMKTPYEMNENTKEFFVKRPEWAKDRAGCSTLSCSS